MVHKRRGREARERRKRKALEPRKVVVGRYPFRRETTEDWRPGKLVAVGEVVKTESRRLP